MMRIDALVLAFLAAGPLAFLVASRSGRCAVGTVEQHRSTCAAGRIATKALPTWQD
jgi:hypothetical protein